MEIHLSKKKIQLFSRHNKEIKRLYVSAFPKIERCPYSMLMRYSLKKEMDMWGYYEGKKFIGFSYMMILGDYAYLLYFATSEELRNKGYGTAIIKDLLETYMDKNMVLDIEPDDPEAANAEQRERRKNFYLRMGYFDTYYEMTDETGDYRIYSTKPESFDIDEFHKFFDLFPEEFDGTQIVYKG